MSFDTCWEVRPPAGQPGMPLDDLLARLAVSFPVHTFDHEIARQGALKRLAALQALSDSIPIPVPEAILAEYRDAYPVDVVLADSPDASEAILKFRIWPEPDRSVAKIHVVFATEDHYLAGRNLLDHMVESLEWAEPVDITDET
ncbi:MAG: hypothetical protein ACRC8S_06790 [Fimbriiglobus sp.]